MPECAESFDEEASRCEVQGGLTELPLAAHCEGGCTRWIYTLEDGVVKSTKLVRTIEDADGWFYRRFAGESETIAGHLVERFGEGEREELGRWREVRRARRGTTVPLERRAWSDDLLDIRYELTGTNGFRPSLELTVVATRAGEATDGGDEGDETEEGEADAP